jgi:hypothetical protein
MGIYLYSEEYGDVFTLQQTNNQLVEELQESRDRLCQSQKDRKIELKDLTDQNSAQAEEIKRLRAEVQKHKDDIAKMRRTCQEAAEKERDLKLALESVETGRRIIEELKTKVEEEQELSFQLSLKQKKDHDEIIRLKIREATSVAMQKEFRLESEAQLLLRIIEYREEQTSSTIRHLMGLSLGPAGSGIVSQLVSELNQYVARLISARDDVDQLLREKRKVVANQPDAETSLDFDLKRVELPPLGHELVPLLLSVSAHPPTGPPLVVNTPASLLYGLQPGVPVPSLVQQGPWPVDIQPPPGMPIRPQYSSSRDRPHSFGKLA